LPAKEKEDVGFADELITERLSLRPPTESDAERVFLRYAQDPLVSRFMSWVPHPSIDHTREYLRRIVGENKLGTSAGYLIFSRADGELLGSIGCRLEGPLVTFGYCLARDCWGRGIATEAARAFVAEVLAQPNVWRIHAFCDVDNRASARVLEKSSLALEGTLRRYMVLPNLGEEPRDMLCFAKVRELQ
jgi:RimJ/RimL family protein N-acetyltransferase